MFEKKLKKNVLEFYFFLPLALGGMEGENLGDGKSDGDPNKRDGVLTIPSTACFLGVTGVSLLFKLSLALGEELELLVVLLL